MSCEWDEPEPAPNPCGGYYCDEEVGHIDCDKPEDGPPFDYKESPTLQRLIEEVKLDEPTNPRVYDRWHNRHNRSGL